MTNISSLTVPVKVVFNGCDISKVIDRLVDYGGLTFDGEKCAVYLLEDIEWILAELTKLKLVTDE